MAIPPEPGELRPFAIAQVKQYVRVLAWLHSIPKKAEKTRYEMLKGTSKAEIPELDWGQHLVDMLAEIGFARPGSAGPIPVSYAEIEAWQRTTNAELPSNEAVLLRQLSAVYCNQLIDSEKPECPRPDAIGPHDADARGKVAHNFKAMIKAYKSEH